MCNLGSTLKEKGLLVQAFEFWWKALRIQPTFWAVLVRESRTPLVHTAHEIP